MHIENLFNFKDCIGNFVPKTDIFGNVGYDVQSIVSPATFILKSGQICMN